MLRSTLTTRLGQVIRSIGSMEQFLAFQLSHWLLQESRPYAPQLKCFTNSHCLVKSFARWHSSQRWSKRTSLCDDIRLFLQTCDLQMFKSAIHLFAASDYPFLPASVHIDYVVKIDVQLNISPDPDLIHRLHFFWHSSCRSSRSPALLSKVT